MLSPQEISPPARLVDLFKNIVSDLSTRILQIILEDRPAIIGPNFDTEAICVECMGRPDGSYLCHKCDMPLCR